jgi:serine/threonine-protein kinase
LLAALDHAHAHGVLHRDVKPENVILVGARPVLIDFGLAVLTGHGRMTATGMCVGSPSYIAPERLIGQPADARTDLYAVGVILFEMLTGSRPFAGDSPQDTMQRALQRPPRPLRSLRRDISPQLEAVVRRALAKEPNKRYRSAVSMLEALADVPVLDSDEPELELKRIDEHSTTAIVTFEKPSRWRRLWAWLRYGGWRWARLERPGARELTRSLA